MHKKYVFYIFLYFSIFIRFYYIFGPYICVYGRLRHVCFPKKLSRCDVFHIIYPSYYEIQLLKNQKLFNKLKLHSTIMEFVGCKASKYSTTSHQMPHIWVEGSISNPIWTSIGSRIFNVIGRNDISTLSNSFILMFVLALYLLCLCLYLYLI